PHDAIGGFAQFTRFARLPIWQVWDLFGQANGVADLSELLTRLNRLSARPALSEQFDRAVGCVVLGFPVFFAPDEWVRVPSDWSRNIVSGRTYDLGNGEGLRLMNECLERAVATTEGSVWQDIWDRHRHGKPQIVQPRLGQASFRMAVFEAYGNACAVTTEHSTPALEAAHIKPWSAGGLHEVRNGLPLRRDLHRLFDLGFMTIRPDYKVAVSPQLRDRYANGRTYYALEGTTINVPSNADARPAQEFLEWHSEELFRAR
ncbi:MAG: putative restriction endonuclease, partial [Thermoleophilaceae bacterium]|nr:putative restriction endonuclease [Thermoleophilaceae bacterium]